MGLVFDTDVILDNPQHWVFFVLCPSLCLHKVMALCDEEGRPRPTCMVVMVAWIVWCFGSLGVVIDLLIHSFE